MLEFISNLLAEYEKILIIIGIVSAIVLVVSLLTMPWLLGKIPVNYFSDNNQCLNKCNFFITMIKNFIGLILLLTGIVMLITPGQGIISILLGLFLMQFPGKRQLELMLINNNITFQTINWLRSKAGKPPLKR